MTCQILRSHKNIVRFTKKSGFSVTDFTNEVNMTSYLLIS